MQAPGASFELSAEPRLALLLVAALWLRLRQTAGEDYLLHEGRRSDLRRGYYKE